MNVSVRISERRALLALPFLIALTGCNSVAQEATRRHEIASRSGTLADVCRAGRDAAEAYLRSGNESEFSYWRAVSAVECSQADAEGGYAPADDEVRRRIMAEVEGVSQRADAAALAAAEGPVDE